MKTGPVDAVRWNDPIKSQIKKIKRRCIMSYKYVVRMTQKGQIISEKKFYDMKSAMDCYNEAITYQNPSIGKYAVIEAL